MKFVSFLIRKTIKLRFSILYSIARFSNSGRSELLKLRKSFKPQPWLVVANGPSLNNTPLEKFTGYPSIGMNKIDLIFRKTKWRPTLITCINSLVVKQNSEIFKNSDIPIFLGWKNRLFQKRSNKGNIFYFPQKPTTKFSVDSSEWIAGFGCTVTYTALQIAYFLNATKVIIVGMDHNFNTDPNRREIVRAEGPDMNHFAKDYFKSGVLWGLPDLKGSEAAYKLARKAYEKDGREILDATIDGKCKVFKKIEMNEALEIFNNHHKL
ncbi:DUF115 domain-containing protein [Verrucomicrobia bacterium]|nr:DUF115 domain-containing protein [Verrucomicrobiota bacterium]MDC0324083.1 DUF115 domain-containing protein [Verrucomicrobiota bacterium]